MSCQVYIASHTPEGGILRCILSPGGILSPMEMYPMDRPAYMCLDGAMLHVILREAFMMQSGIVSFRIGNDGRLYQTSVPQPVHGTVAAHILAVNGSVYCANYLSGSTILMPDRLIAHNGSGPNPLRQRCSHPHCISLSPDGDYICITDLGTDSIYLCTPRLEPVSRVSLPPGSGPRHLVFSRDGNYAYCSNELACSLGILKYSPGRLEYLSSLPLFPEGACPEDSASAIRLTPGGQELLVSTRGRGRVFIFRLAEGLPEYRGEYNLHGAWIRDFNVYGDYLICGDERQDQVLVYSLSASCGSPPLDCIKADKPWCILIAETPD